MEKQCSKCGCVKPTTEFTKNVKRPDSLTVWCKSCSKKARDNYYQENKDKIKARVEEFKKTNPEHVINQRLKYKIKYRAKTMIYAAKHRAKLLEIPFDLEYNDIVIPSTCPVLGIKLDSNCEEQSRNSPSLDRIIPSLGYVKGNVQVISWQANTMKNNATPEELRNFANWVLQFFKDKVTND